MDGNIARNDPEGSGYTQTTPDKKQGLTWTLLGERLGVSIQTLRSWRAKAGAPTEADPEKWEAFVKENGLDRLTHSGRGSEERMEAVRLGNEILKAKLAREQRKTIDRETVSRLLFRLATEQKSLLFQLMETELPPKCDGMTAVQMRPIFRKAADSICDRMAPLIDQLLAQE